MLPVFFHNVTFIPPLQFQASNFVENIVILTFTSLISDWSACLSSPRPHDIAISRNMCKFTALSAVSLFAFKSGFKNVCKRCKKNHQLTNQFEW